MPQETSLTAIAHVIQLAVAPVFLISGVAALLTVLTNRLARIIDRARALAAATPPTPDILEELGVLTQRSGTFLQEVRLATRTMRLHSGQ
jgi:hypothetical protein